MATKKAGSTAKKTTRSSQSKKTKVTATKAAVVSKPVATKSKPWAKLQTTSASALIGEFIGAFLLVCAFLMTKGEPLYMGFIFMTVILMVGALSGGYLNPVTTVGAWVTRRLSHVKAVGYLVAQFLGAGAAFALLTAYMNGGGAGDAYLAAGREVYSVAALTDANHWYVFFAELLGATVFAFAFASGLREKANRLTQAFTAGFGLFIAMLVAGVIASYVSANIVLNPAAALAASAVDWSAIDWFAVATYLFAPLLGGIVGFALRDVVDTK